MTTVLRISDRIKYQTILEAAMQVTTVTAILKTQNTSLLSRWSTDPNMLRDLAPLIIADQYLYKHVECKKSYASAAAKTDSDTNAVKNTNKQSLLRYLRMSTREYLW